MVCIKPTGRSFSGFKNFRYINIVLGLLTGATLAACGGGGSGGDSNPEPQTLSTQEVSTNASDFIGRNFGNTLSGVDATVGTDGDDAADSFSSTNNQVQNFVGTSLLLDDSMASSTIQGGDTLLIDPDESQLCEEELVDEFIDNMDVARCQALMRDVTLQLTSSDGQTGTVTYLFRDSPVATFGYGGNTDSISMDLGGLKSLVDANNALDPAMAGETNTPEILQGEITFSATTINDAPGQEAGSLVIAVSNPVQLGDVDTSFSLANGELLSVTADAGTGTGAFGFDLGALSLTAPFAESDVLGLDLDGFSATLDINVAQDGNAGGSSLSVSNLGIGNGPLFMRINSMEVLQLTMETFGFTEFPPTESVDANGNFVSVPPSLRFDGNMDIALMLDNAVGFDATRSEAFNLMASVMASAGTVLTDSDSFLSDERFGVLQGGPFRLQITESDETGSNQQDVTVDVGECLVDAEDVVEPSGTGSFTSGTCL